MSAKGSFNLSGSPLFSDAPPKKPQFMLRTYWLELLFLIISRVLRFVRYYELVLQKDAISYFSCTLGISVKLDGIFDTVMPALSSHNCSSMF